jgi:hypothetical protein
MPAALYQPIYLLFLTVICLVFGLRYISSNGYEMQEEGSSEILPILLGTVLIIWLGNRPISGAYFGDTANYALSYALQEVSDIKMDWSSEWIWGLLESTCKTANLSVSTFFTIVEAGYIISVLWAVKRFMPENMLLGILFVLTSLSFFTYGVNGLRNGLACHITILGISFLTDKKYIPCAVLFLMALGIHRSVMLPIVASVIGAFLMKSPQKAIYIWIVSIFVSLVAGDSITSLIVSLNFDDKISDYTNASNDLSGFSRAGFRCDFLIYSAMPVLMAWYVCVKRQISDTWYDLIAIVYCLSNSFWIIVNRSSFSNRFAYLSWFIYPLVIAYPLANLPIWEDQDKRTGMILIAYCGFTVVMNVFYW